MIFEEYLEALKNQPKLELMLDFGQPVASVEVGPDEDVELGKWDGDV